MARMSALGRQVVNVLDAKGTLLTAATAGALDEEGTLTLDDVDEHGALIDYYFGRCERVVIVEHGGTALEGTLDTQWLSSERGWSVAMSQSVAARILAPVETSEPAQTLEPVATHEPLPVEPALAEERVTATLVR
jgi:hypothetical protein